MFNSFLGRPQILESGLFGFHCSSAAFMGKPKLIFLTNASLDISFTQLLVYKQRLSHQLMHSFPTIALLSCLPLLSFWSWPSASFYFNEPGDSGLCCHLRACTCRLGLVLSTDILMYIVYMYYMIYNIIYHICII